MDRLKELLRRAGEAIRSPRGRDVLMFMLFLFISAVLWGVLALNEEEQYDLRMPVRITHVPDSVTLLSKGPDALTVNLRARGTQLLKMSLGDTPGVNIDFRVYRSGEYMHLSNAELKALARNASGGSQVSVLYPDSISIPFTTHPGFKLPVRANVQATPGPRASLSGRPKVAPDSVKLYALGGHLPSGVDYINTEALSLEAVEGQQTRRLRLLPPPGTRAIPDSVDVTIEAEPLIMKRRRVVIEPVNVPANIKLITFPAQIEVMYMVPMSAYTNSDPHFRVIADYRRISRKRSKIRLRLTDVPQNLQNVQLSADSAEYIIEQL
ncbi:MAG: hypothetical protein K1V74_00470 [Muribaculaceae bacterium]